MPFEPFETATIEENDGKTRLCELRDILRDRRRWPVGFNWSFPFCDRCAIGLLRRLEGDDGPVGFSEAADTLHISVEEAVNLFGWPVWTRAGLRDGCYVTPEMVANGIDEYLPRKLPSSSLVI